MKKTYALDELDCANCAAKMEAKIAALDEVDETEKDEIYQDICKSQMKEGGEA